MLMISRESGSSNLVKGMTRYGCMCNSVHRSVYNSIENINSIVQGVENQNNTFSSLRKSNCEQEATFGGRSSEMVIAGGSQIENCFTEEPEQQII